MPEDATLDAFATESDGAPDEAGDGDERDVSSDGDERDVSSDGADPAAVTSSWAGDGGTCSSCGERVRRLWADGDERVCTSCKPWARTGEDACDQ